MNLQPVAARWEQLAAREKLLAAGAVALLALALMWWVAIAPAVRVLRGAETQHRTLDAQLQQMLRLQAQAQAMQAQPKQGNEESMRQLEAAIVQVLGVNARFSIAGDRVTVTLAGASSQALAQWLAQVRTSAHALPGEAKLQRNPGGMWEGTLVLTLPPR